MSGALLSFLYGNPVRGKVAEMKIASTFDGCIKFGDEEGGAVWEEMKERLQETMAQLDGLDGSCVVRCQEFSAEGERRSVRKETLSLHTRNGYLHVCLPRINPQRLLPNYKRKAKRDFPVFTNCFCLEWHSKVV